MTPIAAKSIRSRENPFYKSLVRLAASSRERRERQATLLDGPHLIEAYERSGGIAQAVVASESGCVNEEIRALFDRVPAGRRVVLADGLFAAIAQVTTPTGILSLIPTPPRPAPPPDAASCLLLEGLQDAGNLGSMLRSAAAAGLRHVLLSPGSVFAWSPRVLRAGMGAHFFLAIHEGMDLAAFSGTFRGQVIATDLAAGTSLYDTDLRGPVAWIFGNEGAGVSANLAGASRARVRIPMPGPTESLNVAAAAAVCLFEQVRQATAVRIRGARP